MLPCDLFTGNTVCGAGGGITRLHSFVKRVRIQSVTQLLDALATVSTDT